MASTEYVIVEDPHGHGPDSWRVEEDRGGGGSWRVRVAALAAAAVLAVTAAWWWSDDGDPSPAPEPTVTAAPANAARTTAVAYGEYRDRLSLVECMAGRGYPYEVQIVDQAAQLGAVADYLGVRPATAYPDAPLPMLRQPDLYFGRGGQAVEVATGSVGCAFMRSEVDVDNGDAVRSAVEAARADLGFRDVVAEQVWVAQHPAEVSQRVALLRADHGEWVARDTYVQERWLRALEAATGVIADTDVTWIPVTVATTDVFAQAAGLTDAGTAVVIRVGERAQPLQAGLALTRVHGLPCGEVAVSAAFARPYGDEEGLGDVSRALTGACGALIGAGYAEGESLAEVYWD
ncbi:hypothetical protein [Demequina sp. NBRC 110051]|uniref:hypothetical protein n=1 Tax=Demequina sp. NBRC 110051 TaxID=1570340 RepID=UPI0009FCDC7F|nr:hypothetical protein [Demequina sp. NBRC 110051]